eukprot:9479740-Pyramimonas_sp.AAC.1
MLHIKSWVGGESDGSLRAAPGDGRDPRRPGDRATRPRTLSSAAPPVVGGRIPGPDDSLRAPRD